MSSDHVYAISRISSIDNPGIGFGLASFIIILAVLGLVFEIWMLVNLIKNEKLSTDTKIKWAVGMFLIHPVVAIVYFFVARTKNPGSP